MKLTFGHCGEEEPSLDRPAEPSPSDTVVLTPEERERINIELQQQYILQLEREGVPPCRS